MYHFKVQLFWEGQKIWAICLMVLTFTWHKADCPNFCGLLRKAELYKEITRILHVSNVSSVSVPNIVSYSLGAAVRKKYMILSTSCSPISTLLLAKVQMSIILLNNDITYVHRVLSFQGPLKKYGRNTFSSFILWNYNLGGRLGKDHRTYWEDFWTMN